MKLGSCVDSSISNGEFCLVSDIFFLTRQEITDSAKFPLLVERDPNFFPTSSGIMLCDSKCIPLTQ